MYSVKKCEVFSALVVNRLLLHFQGVQLVYGQGLSKVVVKLRGVFYKHLLLLAIVVEYLPLPIDSMQQLFLLFALLSDELLILEVDELDVLNEVHLTLNFELYLWFEVGQIGSLVLQWNYSLVNVPTFFNDRLSFHFFEVSALANLAYLVFRLADLKHHALSLLLQLWDGQLLKMQLLG